MISLELELSPDFAKQIEKLERYDQIANRHLTDFMQGSLTGIQGLTRLNMPVGVSGKARNSIKTDVRTMGAEITGRVFSDIRSPYPYPLVIEFGRKPGKMPPPSALARWVKLVLRPPDHLVNGIAFIVARSIGRRGIKGRAPLQKAVESSKVRIGMLFREAGDRIAEEMSI